MRREKAPLSGTPNVKVVYDTSPGIATRAAHGGSLIRGAKALRVQA
jgi:hypothetical protein